MAQSRTDALACLDVFVGEWVIEVAFPGEIGGSPLARSRFEWTLDRQFLMQRTEIPVPGAPDGLMIVSTHPETGAYTQHYYDSRGVVRVYTMELTGRLWMLTRESPDFTPLDFRQRFTGTFSADENTICGAWEKRFDGADWEHDFDLIYHRAG